MWLKILSILASLVQFIRYLIKRKKGVANFANISLININITFIDGFNLQLNNAKQLEFAEAKNAVTIVNDIGILQFDVTKIKTITFSS